MHIYQNHLHEQQKLPKHQLPYPMALDDTPNRLLQSQKLHDTCPLQQPQAFLHPEHYNELNEKHHWHTGRERRGEGMNQITWTPAQQILNK